METKDDYDNDSLNTTVHKLDFINPFSYTKKYDAMIDLEKSIFSTPGQDKVCFKTLSESKLL